MQENEKSQPVVSGKALAHALSHSAEADRQTLEARYVEFIRNPHAALASMVQFRRLSDALGKSPEDVAREVEAVSTFNRLDALHADQHTLARESDEQNFAYDAAEAECKRIIDAAEFNRLCALSRKNEASERAMTALSGVHRMNDLARSHPHLKLIRSPFTGNYVPLYRPRV